MDIVAEIDDGQADTAELLTYQHGKGHPRTYTEEEKKERKDKKDKERKEIGDIDDKSIPSTASHSSESSDLSTTVKKALDAQAESFLKYSKVLLGAGAKQFYPLDWRALSGVFDKMLPQDQLTLGISVWRVQSPHCLPPHFSHSFPSHPFPSLSFMLFSFLFFLHTLLPLSPFPSPLYLPIKIFTSSSSSF